MANSFDALLASLGFPAADAANQLGLLERRLAMGRDEIGLAGELEREQINLGMEDRGLFRSGERSTRLARQQGGETRRLQQLDIAAAEDIMGLQTGLGRADAQARAQREYEAAMHDLAMRQISASNAQTAAMQEAALAPWQWIESLLQPAPTAPAPPQAPSPSLSGGVGSVRTGAQNPRWILGSGW